LTDINFEQLTTLNSIAQTFNIDKKLLEHIVDNDIACACTELLIAKKNLQGYRKVYKASRVLALFHKNLLVSIENYIVNNKLGLIHNLAHGFVRRRNTFSNAMVHLDQRILIQLDISDFFKSISINAVETVFCKLNCAEKTAKNFAKLTTINGYLAEGLHTSPILANIYFRDLDESLSQLASKFNCLYTRYADDITFSTNSATHEIDIQALISKVEKLLGNSSLELNHKKTRIHKSGQPQYVTGLSISNDKYPRIPRHIKRKIRQELYYIEKFGFKEHFQAKQEILERGYQRLLGWIMYCNAIEPSLAKKFISTFFKFADTEPILFRRLRKTKESNTSLSFYFDEMHYENFFGLVCVLIENDRIAEIKEALTELYSDIIDDQLTKKAKKIFHYCEDNTDIRNRVIVKLRQLNFQAYIAFCKLDAKDYSEEDYLSLFYVLIFDRIHSQYDNNIEILYEENTKIKNKAIQESVGACASLFANEYLKNIKVTAKKTTKQDLISVIPDYVLGLFKDAFLKQEIKEFEKVNYNKIRNKVRLVFDKDNKKRYTRYNQFKGLNTWGTFS